jgi:hypothetical protein
VSIFDENSRSIWLVSGDGRHDPVDEHVNFARRAEFSSDPLEFVLHLICLPVGEHVGKQRNRSA